jgi:chorismate dehydratase
LAKAWFEFTGLPFVFAAWIANKKLPDEFISAFNEGNKIGLQNIEKVIAETKCEKYDLQKYYTENISYLLTDKKREGLNKFLEFIS